MHSRPPVSEKTFLERWLPLIKKGYNQEEIIKILNCSESHYKKVVSKYKDIIQQIKVDKGSIENSNLIDLGFVKDLWSLLKQGKYTVAELEQATHTSTQTIHNYLSYLEKSGYALRRELFQDNAIVYFVQTQSTSNSNIIIGEKSKIKVTKKILCISDTHSGNKAFNKKGLNQILDTAYKEYGVTECFHSGDLCDGYGVYAGQLNDLQYWKEDDQVDNIAEVLSKYPFKYYIISGNHDAVWEKHGSPSPVKQLALKMSNVVASSEVMADVLYYGVLLRLIHGDGGGTYAITYPLQKYLRNLLGGGGLTVPINGSDYKLSILQFGHTHRLVLDDEYSVIGFCPGNFLYPTAFTTRKGLVGPHGGWVMELDICDGEILKFAAHWLRVKEFK